MHWCWVANRVLYLRCQGWLYMLALGSTCWCQYADTGVGSCWFSVVRVIPIVSANMGYVRQGLQEREQEWRMWASWGIIDGGGCEQRVVVMHDITFITPPNCDVSNCVACPLICDSFLRMRLISFWGVCHCMYILTKRHPREFSLLGIALSLDCEAFKHLQFRISLSIQGPPSHVNSLHKKCGLIKIQNSPSGTQTQ